MFPKWTPVAQGARTTSGAKPDWQSLVHLPTIALAEIDRKGRVCYLNAQAKAHWQWHRGVTIPADLRYQLYAHLASGGLLPLRHGGLQLRIEYRPTDQRWFLIGFPPFRQPSGSLPHTLEALPIPFIRLDEDGAILHINPAAQDLLGQTALDVVGHPFGKEQLTKTGTARFETAVQAVQPHAATRVRLKMRTTGKKRRTIEVQLFELPTETGRHIGATLTEAVEVKVKPRTPKRAAAYRQAEQALLDVAQQTETTSAFWQMGLGLIGTAAKAQRVRLFTQNGANPLYRAHITWDRAGESPAPLELPEAARAVLEKVGQSQKIQHIALPQGERSQNRALLDITESHEVILIPLGEQDDVRAVIALERQGPKRRHWNKTDLSALNKLGHVLETQWDHHQTSTRFTQTLSQMAGGRFCFDLGASDERRYTFLSLNLEPLLGHPIEDFLWGENGHRDWLTACVHPEDQAHVATQDHALQSENSQVITYRILDADGTIHAVRETRQVYETLTGQRRVEGILTHQPTSADVASESKADPDRLRNAFLTTMSHEIRTPLGAAHGYADLLTTEVAELESTLDTALPPQIVEFTENIRINLQQAQRLIGDLYDLTNLELQTLSLQQVPVLVRPTVSHIAESFAERAKSKNLALNMRLSRANLIALGDPDRMRQVLEILLDNAIKFTESGGITVRTAKKADTVLLEVKDTGIGMDPEFLGHLFEPFMQEEAELNRRFTGSGVGLALAQRLVDRMQGRLEVESTKGDGSTFRVFLPLAPESD